MAKHIGERRGDYNFKLWASKRQRCCLGGEKSWSPPRAGMTWRMRKKPGLVRGADPEMSLTSGGHLVEIDKGKYVRTDDLTQAEDPPSLEDVVNVKEIGASQYSCLEANLNAEDGSVALVYDLDCENKKIEEMLPDEGVLCRRLEAGASKVGGRGRRRSFCRLEPLVCRRFDVCCHFGSHHCRRRSIT